jgi:hypothetical protein
VRLFVTQCCSTMLIRGHRLPRGRIYDEYQRDEPLPEMKMYHFFLPYSIPCATIIMLHSVSTIYAHFLYLLQILSLEFKLCSPSDTLTRPTQGQHPSVSDCQHDFLTRHLSDVYVGII